MFRLLIPHFLSLYSSLNIDFPWFTTFMIDFLKKIPYLLGVMLAAAAAIGVAYFLLTKNMHPSRKTGILLRIPLLNKLLAVWLTHQFSMQIGSLLKGGLAINDALVILEGNQYLRFFRYEAAKMKQDLLNGLKFEDIIAQRRYFVPELSVIIAHGHSSGLLGQELIDYSEMLIGYAEEKLYRYIVIVQPVLFLFIGSTVLVMFVSMLLPMFNMMNSIK
jgi:competence protein ComGB